MKTSSSISQLRPHHNKASIADFINPTPPQNDKNYHKNNREQLKSLEIELRRKREEADSMKVDPFKLKKFKNVESRFKTDTEQKVIKRRNT